MAGILCRPICKGRFVNNGFDSPYQLMSASTKRSDIPSSRWDIDKSINFKQLGFL